MRRRPLRSALSLGALLTIAFLAAEAAIHVHPPTPVP
jgi:hypothetical protein